LSIESLFRCPACAAGGLVEDDAVLVCLACSSRFPAPGGIPMLVKDPAAHDAAIREAQAVNPEWYLAEQPPEEASPWRHHLRKRRNYVEQALRRELHRRGWKKAERLLDLGCGDGNNLRWLAPFADRLYGSDYNLARLARAQARSTGATLFLADLLNYPIFDDSFDVVFFNHVIEHIPDDMAALSTVHRILKPGGLLVLGAPNEGAWWWQLAYRRAPDILATTDHVHFYTARTIGEKMNAAGLSVFEVKHLGWGPPDFRLDGQWRRHKIVDDLFEMLGRVFVPKQASSLYLMATKNG
jgi:SAM-dependent methyltransferase